MQTPISRETIQYSGVAGPMGRTAFSGSRFRGPWHRGGRNLPRHGNRPQNAQPKKRPITRHGPRKLVPTLSRPSWLEHEPRTRVDKDPHRQPKSNPQERISRTPRQQSSWRKGRYQGRDEDAVGHRPHQRQTIARLFGARWTSQSQLQSCPWSSEKKAPGAMRAMRGHALKLYQLDENYLCTENSLKVLSSQSFQRQP